MSTKTDVKLSTLSYVILYVPNTEEAVPFYKEKLGLKLKTKEDGWVEFDAGQVTVALHAADNLPKERGEGMPYLVFGVEKIHDAYEALKAKGIKFEHAPHEVCSTPDHTGMSADFSDPWGNKISIFGMEPKR